jgi:hypothetical protein
MTDPTHAVLDLAARLARRAAHARELGFDGVASDIEEAIARLNYHDRRVTELLEANNREIERRRAAEKSRHDAKGLIDELMPLAAPLDLLLFCPRCLAQHIDAPAPATGWTNPPHRSHLCHACRHVWRPSDRCTNGIAAIATKGENDGSAHPCLSWEAAVAALSRPRDDGALTPEPEFRALEIGGAVVTSGIDVSATDSFTGGPLVLSGPGFGEDAADISFNQDMSSHDAAPDALQPSDASAPAASAAAAPPAATAADRAVALCAVLDAHLSDVLARYNAGAACAICGSSFDEDDSTLIREHADTCPLHHLHVFLNELDGCRGFFAARQVKAPAAIQPEPASMHEHLHRIRMDSGPREQPACFTIPDRPLQPGEYGKAELIDNRKTTM